MFLNQISYRIHHKRVLKCWNQVSDAWLLHCASLLWWTRLKTVHAQVLLIRTSATHWQRDRGTESSHTGSQIDQGQVSRHLWTPGQVSRHLDFAALLFVVSGYGYTKWPKSWRRLIFQRLLIKCAPKQEKLLTSIFILDIIKDTVILRSNILYCGVFHKNKVC